MERHTSTVSLTYLEHGLNIYNNLTCIQATPDDLRRTINALKLLRYNLAQGQLTPDLEVARASQYVGVYLEGLAHGKSLPDTELQPVDDLAVLAGHAFATLWKTTGDLSPLYNAVAILEFASSKSKQSYVVRLLLIKIYHLLGLLHSIMY